VVLRLERDVVVQAKGGEQDATLHLALLGHVRHIVDDEVPGEDFDIEALVAQAPQRGATSDRSA